MISNDDDPFGRLTDKLARLAPLHEPTIAEAFWRDTLIDASIFREWVSNVGQRDARSRIEDWDRMRCIADFDPDYLHAAA